MLDVTFVTEPYHRTHPIQTVEKKIVDHEGHHTSCNVHSYL